MADRPIIFSGPMIEALLAGRKAMTRRLRLTADKRAPGGLRDSPWTWTRTGDLLWVRETWHPVIEGHPVVLYRADDKIVYHDTGRWDDRLIYECPERWASPIHMPRWASRLTLEVTGVKVERLQDISEEDAMAEGVQKCARRVVGLEGGCDSYVCGFQQVWLSIHGEGAWEANPECVALSFKVHKCNIDQMEKAA